MVACAVAANAVLTDSLLADSVVADAVPTVSSSVENGSGRPGKNVDDQAVGDNVRQPPSQDFEGHVRSNARSKRSYRAPHEGWREYIAASGRLYYHHKATNTTQWKKPF